MTHSHGNETPSEGIHKINDGHQKTDEKRWDMQRPDDNNRITPRSPPSSNRNMMFGTGNPFALDNITRNGLAGYVFQSNNLASMAQFPPQRLQPLPHNHSMTINSQLSMLSDTIAGGMKRRAVNDGFRWNDAKRQKVVSTDCPAIPNKESPIIMQRLSSMTGGFPMPKWGAINKTAQSQSKQQGAGEVSTSSSAAQSKLLPKHGAFPLPPLSTEDSKNMTKLALRPYRELWNDTDLDLRGEVLARKLERGPLGVSKRRQTRLSFT